MKSRVFCSSLRRFEPLAGVFARGNTPLAALLPANTALVMAMRGGVILPNGRTYKPAGRTYGGLRMPVTPEFAQELNHLAKAAHTSHNFRDALGMYDLVLRTRRDKLGAIHVDCAATLNNIGRVFVDLRNFSEAEVALTEACAIYEKLLGGDSLKYAESLSLLALCYLQLDLAAAAENAFREALGVFKKQCFDTMRNSWLPSDRKVPENPSGSPLASVAHCLSDCANLFLQQSHFDEAADFLEQALEIRRFLYTKNKDYEPAIAQTLAKLAEVKRHQGHIDRSDLYIDECLDLCMEHYGRDSAPTAQAMSCKGNNLAAHSRFREARKHYEQACTSFAMAFGKESPLVGTEFLHIGNMQEMLNEVPEAEKSYMKAEEIFRNALGNDHLQLADALQFIGALLIKRLKYDAAIAKLREAFHIRTQKTDKNDQGGKLVFCCHKLGEALACKKDPEAEAFFLRAVELYSQLKDEKARMLVSDAKDDLGLFYVEMGHLDKAEECFREALEVRKKNPMIIDKHPTIAYSHSNLGVLHLAKKQYPEAIAECDEAISMYTFMKDAVQKELALADAYTTKAEALRALKEYSKSRELHESALLIRQKQGEVTYLATAETHNNLAKVEIELKNFASAAKHLAEAEVVVDKYPEVTVQLRHEIEVTKRAFASASRT